MPYNLIMDDEPIQIDSIVTVIFGEPGMAKTSLAYTAKQPLLLDFDRGSHRAVGRKATVKMEKWEDAISVMDDIEAGKLPFKPETLIIDTAGTMLDDFMASYVGRQDFKNKKKGGELSLQGYGALKSTANQFFSRAKALNIDLIFVCHTEQFRDGDEVKHRPKMTGGSYDVLISKADLVGYMESKNNKRTLNFNPTDRHVGKNTPEFNLLEIPHYEDEDFQGYMDRLIGGTKERIAQKSEAQQKALKELEEFKKEISNLKGVETERAKELQSKIYNLSPSYKAQLTKLFNEKYLSLWDNKIEKLESVQEFNEMLEVIPKHCFKQFLKQVKAKFTAAATNKGLEYVKDVGEYIPIQPAESAEEKQEAPNE